MVNYTLLVQLEFLGGGFSLSGIDEEMVERSRGKRDCVGVCVG